MESGEQEEALKIVDKADLKGYILKKFIQVFSLIFVAEWGDRSMLATVALATTKSPIGVFLGALTGHALATMLAIIGGSLVGRFISEKTINLVNGIFFIIFAILTFAGLVGLPI